MNVLRCKKCGAAIVTDDVFFQRLLDRIDETTKKAEQCKNGSLRAVYIQEISTYKSMYKSYMHNLSKLEEMQNKDTYKLREIIRYIRDRELISEDQIKKIYELGEKRATENARLVKREISLIYGKFDSMSNRTKADPTAEAAFRKK